MAKDLLGETGEIVVKITNEHEMNYLECTVLQKLVGSGVSPKAFSGGIFEDR